MSSPTASDIISYIGIPLAVLGVLPIIYTCVSSIVTLQSTRRLLRKNGLTAITRGSLMSGVVEVELPRCSITLLDRDDPNYWLMNRKPSSLKGGTWSLFHWNQILTGHTMYRLQYSDELREPQAEIDFEELFTFLLDRGAVPDVKGIHMLRLAGLWTPTGTTLLLSPDGSKSVLRISMPDDSDGVLSLTVHWREEWDQRDGDSLQPSWMHVQDYLPTPDESGDSISKAKQDSEADFEKDSLLIQKRASDDIKQQPSDIKKNPFQSTKSSTSTASLSSQPHTSPGIRIHIGIRASTPSIDAATWDPIAPSFLPTYTQANTLSVSIPGPSLNHLHQPPASLYIPAFAIAHAHLAGRPPYTTHIPPAILALAAAPAIPAGVLVLLNLIPESDAPAIFTQYDPHEYANEMSQKMRLRLQRAMAESRLPPAQAQAARALREAEELSGFHDEFVQRQRRDRERAEKRDMEALNSTRVENYAAAAAAFSYLQQHEKGGFENCEDMKQAIEKMLYRMVVEESACENVCGIVGRWRAWVDRGGMNKEDLKVVRQGVGWFCWGAVLVGGVGWRGGRRRVRWGLICRSVLGFGKRSD